ncbi:hypothetical protein KsCSTR_05860 [Candidatus Kuenenia stuttgartiensis]|uniref:Uncharacterized protein n=1 Tax=Kuenenia stuttgartiensis TaxID=174633 RepID=A0A6G7GKB3_KUEST|nr:hypothetical protein KsCSTR_05860 [Candidatus Kuenenia stuttgartiensis]
MLVNPDRVFFVGSGLQANVIKLSKRPQKSPLIKAEKGHCF